MAQWHLEQLAVARPSCWLGHHQQVARVTVLTWLWTNLSRHSSAMGTFSARNCGHLGHQPAVPTLGQAMANDRLRHLIHSKQVIQPSPSYFAFRNRRREVKASPNILE